MVNRKKLYLSIQSIIQAKFMKDIYFFGFIFLLVFTGCSSIYTVRDFSSPKELYQNFNNFAKDKKLEIKFKGDSTVTLNNGAFIENDTLYSLEYNLDKKSGKIALSEIKILNYTSSDYKSATLLLKNGKQADVEDINVANDTMEYSISKKIPRQIKVASINSLREASYKNHWLGVPPRFLICTATGLMVGLTMGGAVNDYTQAGASRGGYYFVSSLSAGALVGIIWGWIDGYNYIYQFNP